MHLNVLLALFCSLTIGQTFVNGASTAPPPPSSPPPASSPPPDSTAPLDIGMPAPGAPDLNSCSEKNPCTDQNSKCVDSRCLCNDGYGPGDNNTCIKAPGLGDPCRVGSQEFYCTGFGVDFVCPPNGTVCVCRNGYEPDTKDSCKPASRVVGAACKTDGDCTAAFTTCQSGKCACIEGFKAADKGGLCTPTEYKCLNGDKALQAKGSVVLCTLMVNSDTGDIGNDTCPSTHFCNNWQNSLSTTRSLVGHCCPKPKEGTNITATCPIGVPHKTGLCPDLTKLPADAPIPSDLGPLCPLGNGYDCFRGSLCCPLACRSSNSHFNVDGKCFDSVILDQSCALDVQCLPNSACTKGKCQCNKGYKQLTPTLCWANGEPSPFGPTPA